MLKWKQHSKYLPQIKSHAHIIFLKNSKATKGKARCVAKNLLQNIKNREYITNQAYINIITSNWHNMIGKQSHGNSNSRK